MSSQNYSLKRLNPEKYAARVAAIQRVSERTGIPAMKLLCGKPTRSGRGIQVIERGTGRVIVRADTVEEIK